MNSLYLRLNLATLLVLIGFLALIGAVLDNAYRESARFSLREGMLGQIYQLLNVATIEANGALVMPLPTELPYAALALPHSGLYAFVTNNQQQGVLWRSPSLTGWRIPATGKLQIGEQHWAEIRMEDGNDYYLLGYGFQRTVKSGIHSVNFYLMSELAPLQQEIAWYRQRLWGGLLAVAVFLIVIQLWVLRWGLKPLRELGLELNGIEQGSLDRINGVYPAEVRKLTHNINNLLYQERARQVQYRNALDDLAHSLKTPLAVLLGAADQPETLSATVHEQTGRMLKIVERQLQRAGTAGHTVTTAPILLFPIAERLIASLNKVYRSKQVHLINRIPEDLRVRCDESDVMEILGNLLDNAYKWCRGRIEISASQDGQQLLIEIHDDGPGIDAENRSKILERGGRADELTPGHGYGLSIAQEIVSAYLGRLKIETSYLGGAGIRVELNA